LWYWLCLWPLIAVRLANSETGEAVDDARTMLVPPQQRFPDELERPVGSAVKAWEERKALLAERRLVETLEVAKPLGYC